MLFSLLVVAAATLAPTSGPGGQRFLWGFDSRPVHLIETALNAALFFPIGISAHLLALSARRTLMMAAALSLAIELLQLFVIPGRFGELQDVVANVIGAGVGWLLVGLVRAEMTR
jgi:glycopeptide antibiotics resistance protein